MRNFILNKKYLWANILLMLITYGIWIIVYIYLSNTYKNESFNSKVDNFRTFSIGVAGVTFNNEDGTNRQKIIKNLHINQELKLVPYLFENKEAIYVKTLDNKIVGNIPHEHIKQITNKLSNNLINKVIVKENNKFTNENNEEIYYLKIKLFINKEGK